MIKIENEKNRIKEAFELKKIEADRVLEDMASYHDELDRAKSNELKLNSENEKIRIIADKLLAEIDAGVIEFVGNVKATQAETVVTSDRLKIIYTPEANKEPATVLKPVAIEKIIASGKVKIRYIIHAFDFHHFF